MKIYSKNFGKIILILIFIVSCNEKKITHKEAITNTKTTTNSSFSFVESDMKIVDLSTVSDYVNVIMKIPTNAKVIKNGNGNIDILLNKNYIITVDSSVFLESYGLKESVANRKSLYLDESFCCKKGIITRQEPNGFVYFGQTKDAENITKNEPEYHFSYSFTNGKEMYTIHDSRPLDNFDMPGSTYTEANANTLYDWVKSSAKIKTIVK